MLSTIVYPKGMVFPSRLKRLSVSADGIRYHLKKRRGHSCWWLNFKVRRFKVSMDIYTSPSVKSIQVNGYSWFYNYPDRGWFLEDAEGLPSNGLPEEVATIVNNALQAIAPALRQARQAEALEDQINRDKAKQAHQRELAKKQRHFSRVLQQLR